MFFHFISYYLIIDLLVSRLRDIGVVLSLTLSEQGATSGPLMGITNKLYLPNLKVKLSSNKTDSTPISLLFRPWLNFISYLIHYFNQCRFFLLRKITKCKSQEQHDSMLPPMVGQQKPVRPTHFTLSSHLGSEPPPPSSDAVDDDGADPLSLRPSTTAASLLNENGAENPFLVLIQYNTWLLLIPPSSPVLTNSCACSHALLGSTMASLLIA